MLSSKYKQFPVTRDIQCTGHSLVNTLLISYARVTGRQGLLSYAKKAARCLALYNGVDEYIKQMNHSYTDLGYYREGKTLDA